MMQQGDDGRADRQAAVRARPAPARQQDAQDLLRGVGHGGERVGGEDGQRFDLGQSLVGCRAVVSGAPMTVRLILPKARPDRSARCECFLGGDQAARGRAFEILRSARGRPARSGRRVAAPACPAYRRGLPGCGDPPGDGPARAGVRRRGTGVVSSAGIAVAPFPRESMNAPGAGRLTPFSLALAHLHCCRMVCRRPPLMAWDDEKVEIERSPFKKLRGLL